MFSLGTTNRKNNFAFTPILHNGTRFKLLVLVTIEEIFDFNGTHVAYLDINNALLQEFGAFCIENYLGSVYNDGKVRVKFKCDVQEGPNQLELSFLRYEGNRSGISITCTNAIPTGKVNMFSNIKQQQCTST